MSEETREGQDFAEEVEVEGESKELSAAELLGLVAANEEKIHSLSQANSQLSDQLIRLQADFDNFRKRNVKERTELVERATETLIGQLLPVLDNFKRALTAPPEAENFRQGVEMIYRQLKEVLENQGLEEISALGQSFDPKTHEAVSSAPTAEHEANTVISEFQTGYALKGKILRPAMVEVAVPPEETTE